MRKPQIRLSALDKVIGYISPAAQANRVKAKMAMASAEQLGYIVPGSRKKTMKGVAASANSPEADTANKLKGTRALARDMVMNTPLAVAAIARTSANVVGSGLMPQIVPDHTILGITEVEAKEWGSRLEKRFDTWAASKKSDATELFNFYDNQYLAFTSVVLNGDMGFILPWRKQKAWPWELKVKLIEADLIRNPETSAGTPAITTKDIINGVEFKAGRVVAYHVTNYYPHQLSALQLAGKKPKSVRFPLYDTQGKTNFFHLMPPGQRIGQRRGMGMLAPVLDMLKTLSRYSEAHLVGELTSALFTVFIKDMSGMGSYLNEGFTPSETVGGGGTVATEGNGQEQYGLKDEDSQLDIEMGNGNIMYLDDQKEVQFADPKRDPAGFDPFFRSMVRQISAAIEIPPEQLVLEFNSNYSAARAALLEAWKMYRRRRLWLSRNFCQPILEAFIEEEVAKGITKAPGFLEDPVMRAAWAKTLWVGPGNGQIDPLKEAKASVTKIQNNLSTYEEEYMADKGGRWDAAMGRKAGEQQLLKDLDMHPEARVENTEELTGSTGTDPALTAATTK